MLFSRSTRRNDCSTRAHWGLGRIKFVPGRDALPLSTPLLKFKPRHYPKSGFDPAVTCPISPFIARRTVAAKRPRSCPARDAPASAFATSSWPCRGKEETSAERSRAGSRRDFLGRENRRSVARSTRRIRQLGLGLPTVSQMDTSGHVGLLSSVAPSRLRNGHVNSATSSICRAFHKSHRRRASG